MMEGKEPQLNIDTDFLLPEVRNGFYIPTAIKQAWAAELMVLDVIDRICSRHNISYFADWGTLLGAVRHGGFIPWDDDLDICMKREDYIRFCQVAEEELPEGFRLQKYDNQDDFWLFLARVVNAEHICFEPEHLRKYHGFPYIACIDIFVLDYMNADEEKEQARRDKLLYALAVAEELIGGSRHATDSGYSLLLDELENRLGRPIIRKKDDRQQIIEIYRIVEDEFGNVPINERGNLTQLMPWGLKGKGFVLPPKYYEKAIRLPFENTTIPVPYAYNAMLSRRYGNYLTPVKNAGGHDYPYFEGQKKALLEVMDFEFPTYRFEKNSLAERMDAETGKATILECLEELSKMASGESADMLQQAVADCQQLAISIGGYIEEIWEKNHPAIRPLENFCNEIIEIFDQADTKSFKDLSDKVDTLTKELKEVFLDRREILFICDSLAGIETFSKLIDRYAADENNDLSLIVLPLLGKDYDGSIIFPEELEEEAASAFVGDCGVALKGRLESKGVKIIPWISFNCELRHPDMIFIENPYDDQDPCHSIPAAYYSRIVRNCTEKLVYVQHFISQDFSEDMERDCHNLKSYVNVPGVTYADLVYVPSWQMRRMYIESLTEFAGEDTRAIWEERIVADGSIFIDGDLIADKKACEADDLIYGKNGLIKAENDRINSKNGRKKLLYCIGIGNVLENPEEKLRKIHRAFITLEEHSDKLDYDFCLYPDLRSNGDLSIPNGLAAILEGHKEHMVMDVNVDKYSAFYGDASFYVPLFMETNKPIMIAE